MLSLVKPLASLVARGGRQGRLSVLIYHRVRPQRDPLRPNEIDAATFRWHMQLLAKQFNPLPLSVAARRLRQGTLPARAVCVTFDDGYADNLTEALPILQQTGVPATFFIASGYLNGGRMWNDTVIETVRRLPVGSGDFSEFGLGTVTIHSTADRIQLYQRLIGEFKYLPLAQRQRQVDALAARAAEPLPGDLMLTSEQLKTLQAGGEQIEIGAHTVNHPILARLSPAAARQEMADSKQTLENLLQRPVTLFAYPNGKPGTDYLPEHPAIARELGFDAAVSTAWGVSRATTDRWQLPRFTPWDKTPARFMARLLLNYRHPKPA